jgi:hypothetical protein
MSKEYNSTPNTKIKRIEYASELKVITPIARKDVIIKRGTSHLSNL